MSILPYLRPDIDQGNLPTALVLFGQPSLARPGLAYSGYLNILNRTGACAAEQISGDALPPGSSIYASGDNVFIEWPEYSEETAVIQNPGFENSDKGWDFGSGWDVSGENPISGLLSARYSGVSGYSTLSSSSRYAVNPGEITNASCQVRQGSSSAGNAGAAVALEYRDESGSVLATHVGNYVMSGSNNAVHGSTISSVAPASSSPMTVNVASIGLRKRQNRSLYVDTFQWDAYSSVSGINHDATLKITIKLTDSDGRVAYWSGSITVAMAYWDGSWNAASSPVSYGWFDMIWSTLFEKFYVCGYYNAAPYSSILGSDDGSSFTALRAVSGDYFTAICEAPELGRVMAWSPGVTVSSVNGSTFSVVGSTPWEYKYSVAWSPELMLFAAISSGEIYTSPTGYPGSWTNRGAFGGSSGSNGKVRWFSQAGVFVVTAGTGIRISSDGVTWTTPSGISSFSAYDSMYMDNISAVVLVGTPSAGGAGVFISHDNGSSFTAGSSPPIGYWGFKSGCSYSPELKCGVISSGNACGITTDGTDMVSSAPFSGGNYAPIAWSPKHGVFVSVSIGPTAIMIRRSTPAY